jgi:predicted nucleic acid-binding protein
VLIDAAHLLLDIYGQVLIPEAVVRELQMEQTPAVVRMWMQVRPSWIEVCAPILEAPTLQVEQHSALAALGDGERQAIFLALALRADLMLMDERAGVREAQRLGIASTGTLGILSRRAELGLLDFAQAIEKLKQTNFRVHPRLLDAMLNKFEQI